MTSRKLSALPPILAAIAVAACAQPTAGTAMPAPAASLSLPANAGPTATPPATTVATPAAGGHTMGGMDMSGMMAQCAEIRKQPDAGSTPMGKMMLDHCNEMDRSMGHAAPPKK